MKNYALLVLALAAIAMFAPTCQKSPSSPFHSEEATENPSDAPVSDRSGCCDLTIFVEVANWSTVNYITVTYQTAGSVTFTATSPISYDVCADPGTVQMTISGGPAAVFARVNDATGNRVAYLVNLSSSSSSLATCTKTLVNQPCDDADPWSGGNCLTTQ